MALFNISGVNPELFFNYNLGFGISLFSVFVLPPFLLSLLCVVSLIFTKKINKKIRVLFINIFAAEICSCLHNSFLCLGFPVRFRYQDTTTCKLFLSAFMVAAEQKFTAGTLYAINIYLLAKYGEKKLKWHVIMPYIIISWMASAIFGMLPYNNEFGVITTQGFCTANTDSHLLQITVLVLFASTALFLCIQVFFSIITAIYIKKHTLEGNSDIKKAVAKVLIYLLATSVLSYINNIVPSTIPFIREALQIDDIFSFLALYYITVILVNIPTIAIPIVTLVFMKPIRTTLCRIYRDT